MEPRLIVHIHNKLVLFSLSMIQRGASTLYMASQEGHDDVVQLLLDGGARIDLPTKVY